MSAGSQVWEFLGSIGSNPLNERKHSRPDFLLPKMQMTSGQAFSGGLILEFYEYWKGMRSQLDRREEKRDECLRALAETIGPL